MTHPPSTPPESSPGAHDPALSRLLQSWQVHTPLPPGFAQEVHRRIRNHSPSPHPSPSQPALIPLVLRFLALFQRPVFASLYIAGGIILGGVSGAWKAHPRPSLDSPTSDLQSRYVASIDPYQMQRLRTEPSSRTSP